MKKYIIWIVIVVIAVGGYLLKKSVDDRDTQKRISDYQKQQAIHQIELQMFDIRQDIAQRKVQSTYVPATTAASVALFVYQPEDIEVLKEISGAYRVETAAAIMIESLNEEQFSALMDALQTETCEVALFCFARTPETNDMLLRAKDILGSRCTCIGIGLTDSKNPEIRDELLQMGFPGIIRNLNQAAYEATENGSRLWNYCVASSTSSFRDGSLGTILNAHLPVTFLFYFNGQPIDRNAIDRNMQQLLSAGDEITFMTLNSVSDAVAQHADIRSHWADDLEAYVAEQEARLDELQKEIDNYDNK